MKDMMNLMQQAKDLQVKMQATQEKITDLHVEGRAGGGLVRITLSGEAHMKKVHIDPSLLLAEEAEVVEDLIVAAYQDAKIKLDNQKTEIMQSALGGLPLPPGMKVPF